MRLLEVEEKQIIFEQVIEDEEREWYFTKNNTPTQKNEILSKRQQKLISGLNK